MPTPSENIPTNILAMPLAHLVIRTGNNEDWIDSIQYRVGDETGPPLDLRGVYFDMMLRFRPTAHDVILHASTDNGWLSVGAAPDFGHLVFFVPKREMQSKFAGQYVGDVKASDERFERVVLTVDLTVIEGVTKL